MRIGTRETDPDHPPYIIAELGVNHDGSVDKAIEMVDAAQRAGADAIKLQLFDADLLLSKTAKLAAYQKRSGADDPLEMLRRLQLAADEMAQPAIVKDHREPNRCMARPAKGVNRIDRSMGKLPRKRAAGSAKPALVKKSMEKVK